MKKMLLALAAMGLTQLALAQGIKVGDAYSFPTLDKTQGGAFVSLINTDAKDDVLVGVDVDKSFADSVALHTHLHENGVMRMVEVKDGIPLPAGKTQELKRGGYHIMFFGLKKLLNVGDKFTMTLKYRDHAPKEVLFTVRPMTNQPQHHDHHDHHDHHHHH